jgi:6-phosphogluconolactonase
MNHFHLLADKAEMIHFVASSVAELIRGAEGSFTLALSGGSTPEPIYARLAEMNLPWERVTVIQVDERWVPETDPASNAAMIRRSLVAATGVKFLAFPTLGPTSQVQEYGEWVAALPSFDLALLGMGADGHTASLFPGDAALQADGWATTGTAPVQPQLRGTLTLGALQRFERAMVLIDGADKTETLQKIAADRSFPIRRVTDGIAQVDWFITQAAAGKTIQLF